MDIFKLIIAKYLLGYLLQDIIVVLGIFTFNKKPIEIRKFILINTIFIPTTILVRCLPISFGIHTLINLAVLIFITFYFFHFDLYPTVKSTLVTIVLLLLTEIISIFTMLGVFGQETMNVIMLDSYLKALSTIPMNFLFGIIILFQYKRMLKTI